MTNYKSNENITASTDLANQSGATAPSSLSQADRILAANKTQIFHHGNTQFQTDSHLLHPNMLVKAIYVILLASLEFPKLTLQSLCIQ